MVLGMLKILEQRSAGSQSSYIMWQTILFQIKLASQTKCFSRKKFSHLGFYIRT